MFTCVSVVYFIMAVGREKFRLARVIHMPVENSHFMQSILTNCLRMT